MCHLDLSLPSNCSRLNNEDVTHVLPRLESLSNVSILGMTKTFRADDRTFILTRSCPSVTFELNTVISQLNEHMQTLFGEF